MNDRWSKLAPLTGLLFVVLAVVALCATSAESPEANARAVTVLGYYTAHRSEVQTSAILFALAFLVLVLFAGVLRAYLRRTAATEGLSALVLAGAILMAVGALSTSGMEFGLAHNIHSLGLQEARTLNFVAQELFLPILAGGFVFGVCSGIAILRGAALPKWLGWAAIVIGIVTIVPPAAEFALLAFVLWVIAVSILMYMRMDVPAQADPAVPQPAV